MEPGHGKSRRGPDPPVHVSCSGKRSGSPGPAEPVRALRHPDLEPCVPAEGSRLADRAFGDAEDLPGEEEAQTGIVGIATVEDPLLVLLGDPDPVILAAEHEPVTVLRKEEPDRGHM